VAVPERGAEALYGNHDENLRFLEGALKVRIKGQGSELLLEGVGQDVEAGEARPHVRSGDVDGVVVVPLGRAEVGVDEVAEGGGVRIAVVLERAGPDDVVRKAVGVGARIVAHLAGLVAAVVVDDGRHRQVVGEAHDRGLAFAHPEGRTGVHALVAEDPGAETRDDLDFVLEHVDLVEVRGTEPRVEVAGGRERARRRGTDGVREKELAE